MILFIIKYIKNKKETRATRQGAIIRQELYSEGRFLEVLIGSGIF